MSYASVQITCGTPGSGKSFSRGAVYLVEEWLPEEEGLFITNFPYTPENREEIAAYYAERKKLSVDDARAVIDARLISIPAEIKSGWMDGTLAPLEYFSTLDCSGAHIAIDEIHNYIPQKATLKTEQAWNAFIGEIRHLGATFEALSQDEYNINGVIRKRAEIKRYIVKRESELIPFLKIPVGDVMQFVYKFRGRRDQFSRVYEYKRVSDTQWVKQNDYNVPLSPFYFKFYDSHAGPEAGGASGGKERKQPYQKYSWLGLCIWFLRKHTFRFALVSAALCAFVWFCFLGGVSTVIQKIASVATVALGGGNFTGEADTPQTPEQKLVSLEKEKSVAIQERDAIKTRLKATESVTVELAVMKATLESMTALTAITPDSILLKDGSIVVIGQPIPTGTYANEKLSAIDMHRYCATLANGVVLRLPAYQPPTQTPESGANRNAGTLQSGHAGTQPANKGARQP